MRYAASVNLWYDPHLPQVTQMGLGVHPGGEDGGGGDIPKSLAIIFYRLVYEFHPFLNSKSLIIIQNSPNISGT